MSTRCLPSGLREANGFNRIVFNGGKQAKIGIVAAGKSYLDVRQALEDLGIDEAQAAKLGVRLLKIGMVWPLEPSIIKIFARGLDSIIVVEEKRSLIETQLKDILYTDKERPTVIGKTDETGAPLVSGPWRAGAHRDRHGGCGAHQGPRRRRPAPRRFRRRYRGPQSGRSGPRVPYFCAGCPHNSSTVLPEGARGYAGIGCHWLAQFVPGRKTEGSTHMGGEGANWIGEAPFSKRTHVFQNIGDGTYNHSGLMAIRHAANSGVNITYKILFNDAVAMTGGQKNDGGLDRAADRPADAGHRRRTHRGRFRRAGQISVDAGFPQHVSFHHRDDLQAVQTEMMGVDRHQRHHL